MWTPNPGNCSTPSHLKHFEGKQRQQGVSGRAGVKPQAGRQCLTWGEGFAGLGPGMAEGLCLVERKELSLQATQGWQAVCLRECSCAS